MESDDSVFFSWFILGTMWAMSTYLIVCPLVFLAGLVDAIAGGGGLISLPAYVLAGVPMHMSVGTNKLANSFGTALTTWKFYKKKLISLRLALPSIVMAIVGASMGARISLLLDENVMRTILLIVLPITAVIVLNKNFFHEDRKEDFVLDTKTLFLSSLVSWVVGIYDGIYGPGTGTFLMIGFTLFAKMGIVQANAQAKIINLTTNISALVIFVLSGQVDYRLGLVAALCNMIGNFVGSELALHKGGGNCATNLFGCFDATCDSIYSLKIPSFDREFLFVLFIVYK